MKLKVSLLITLLFCLLFSCKISDIRTPYLLENKEDVNKKNLLLNSVEEQYGGYENWIHTPAITAIGYDEWPTFFWRLVANPWREKKTEFSYKWLPNTDNSRMLLTSGKDKGKVYGIQNWMTYTIKDASPVFKKKKSIWFHLPTMEYFMEFPFRIREAEFIKYAGTRLFNQTSYELLFITWDSETPNKRMDQYLIYINPDTHLIDYLELTVRDQGKWTYATVRFFDFIKKSQFTFPSKMEFYFQNKLPGKKIGHQIGLSDIIIHDEVDISEIVPEPARKAPKFRNK